MIQIPTNLTKPEFRTWYHEVYLETPHWKEVRRKVLEHYKSRCFGCGSTERLQAHHIVYGTLGQENLDELVCLCARCHKLNHELWPKAPPGFTPLQIRDALQYFLVRVVKPTSTKQSKVLRRFMVLPEELQRQVFDGIAKFGDGSHVARPRKKAKAKKQKPAFVPLSKPKDGSTPFCTEKPLRMLPSLAIKFGICEALVLQNLHEMLMLTGCAVVGKSYQDWQRLLPFMSEKTIMRAMQKLKKLGVIQTMHSKVHRLDRTLRYTINYDKLATS